MNQTALKNILPHFAAIFLIFAVTFIYFKPEFTDGLSLKQDDMLNYKGVIQEIKAFEEATGEISMWSGSMFSGMPAYIFYPKFNYGIIPLFEKTLKGFLSDSKGAHLFFLSSLCMYILLLSFRVRHYVAVTAAIAFALTSYNLILTEVGHVTKLWAISYGCLILAGIRLAFKGKLWLGVGLTALAMALEVKAAHFQITFYLGFVAAFFVLSELFYAYRENKILQGIKISALLVLAVGVGFATNAGKLMTTLEYTPYSTRGGAVLQSEESKDKGSKGGLDKKYVFDWSQGKFETLTLLVPLLYGGASQEQLDEKSNFYQAVKSQIGNQKTVPAPTYWGDQPFTMGPIYAGAIVCFLFVLGLLILDKRHTHWILAGFALTVMLAWGRNFELLNYTLYDFVPGFNKFRSVSMALSISIMLMVLTAALTLEKVLFSKEKISTKDFLPSFYIALGLTAGVAFLIAAVAGMLDYSAPVDAQMGAQGAEILRLDRISLARSSAWRSLIFILLAAAPIFIIGTGKKFKPEHAFIAIAFLMTTDLWFIGKRYLNFDSFSKNTSEELFAQSEADKVILSDGDPNFRVANLLNPFNEATTSYYHKSIGGYFAVKMRRYQDLIERNLQGEIENGIKDLQTKGQINFDNARVLNMLNTKYFKFGTSPKNVIQNPKAFGNAWFVENVKTVNTPDEEIAALSSEDLKKTAILDVTKFKTSKTTFETDSAAAVKFLSYKPNELIYETSSEKDGFVVFSEIWYPAWKAEIDGKPVDIQSVNYVLRGLEVPAGKHKIVFKFVSETFEKGNLITTIASYLAVLTILAALGMEFIKSNNKKNEGDEN
jgi:hypothetical protein